MSGAEEKSSALFVFSLSEMNISEQKNVHFHGLLCIICKSALLKYDKLEFIELNTDL